MSDVETTVEEVEYPRTRHSGSPYTSRRSRRPSTMQELLAQQPYTQLYNRCAYISPTLCLLEHFTDMGTLSTTVYPS